MFSNYVQVSATVFTLEDSEDCAEFKANVEHNPNVKLVITLHIFF